MSIKSVVNLVQSGAICFRRDALKYVDIVGVTGSIPVTRPPV
jgi:hypothetical protein